MRLISAVCLMLAAAPAFAAESADLSTENGRYAMTPAPEGFLRLDTRTGAVSLCTVSGAAASCRAAAEERKALEEELDRLTQENARLKQQASGQPPSKYGLPKDEDIDRAMGFAERFMKRMMKILREDQPADKG